MDEAFGAAMRRRRQAADMTVAGLAQRVGVAEQTLYRWERGNTPRSKAMRKAWNRALLEAESEIKVGGTE